LVDRTDVVLVLFIRLVVCTASTPTGRLLGPPARPAGPGNRSQSYTDHTTAAARRRRPGAGPARRRRRRWINARRPQSPGQTDSSSNGRGEKKTTRRCRRRSRISCGGGERGAL